MKRNNAKIICVLCAGVKKDRGVWTSTDETDFKNNVPGGNLRNQATYYLFSKDKSYEVFVPGGRGHHIPGDDASRPDLSDVIEKELERIGIPKNVIHKENRSNDTGEQLFALMFFCKKNGIGKATVVTSGYHLERVNSLINYFPGLSSAFGSLTFELVSAEDVLLKFAPNEWEGRIKKYLANPSMKVLVDEERKKVSKIGKGYPSPMFTVENIDGLRFIRNNHDTFVIAELSGNHLQDYNKAEKLVRAAAEAGAGAVKLQTYTADTMTIDSDKEWFRVGGKDNPKEWQGQTLYQLYQKANTPWDWHPKLQKLAQDLGLVFFSTPFDSTSVDFLEKLEVPCYKIASYEVTDIPLLKKVASTGKPVIMSVGFADKDEVMLAVKTLRESGCGQIALLHCLTSYGSAPDLENANLKTIKHLETRFGVVAGFSDNNAGIDLPVKAVMAGATMVEKHLTLSRVDGGPDAQFSLEPWEMKEMIKKIRGLDGKELDEKDPAWGKVHYGPANEQEEYNRRFRRSLFAVRNIKKDEKFTEQNVRVIRPAFGLEPKYYGEVLGKKASKDIESGTPLTWELVI